MKTEIFYFSGTGNSFIVARDIAKGTDGKLTSIPDKINDESIKSDAECIGIVFPVYFGGYPLIIDNFLKKIENIKDKYIFAVVTCGGSPGASINLFEKLVESFGGKLSGAFSIQMPGNYIPFYGAIDETKQKNLFENENKKVISIIDYVKSGKQGFIDNSNFIMNFVTKIIYNIATKRVHEMDKNFRSDEKCNGCGTCAKVCPVKNIELKDNKPVWKNQCEQCFACLQWCPKAAIEYKNSSVGRKRYHHPDVKITDMINND